MLIYPLNEWKTALGISAKGRLMELYGLRVGESGPIREFYEVRKFLELIFERLEGA